MELRRYLPRKKKKTGKKICVQTNKAAVTWVYT